MVDFAFLGSQTRTYQDLLKDKHDEALFEHFSEANLVSVSLTTGEVLAHVNPNNLRLTV